MLHRQAADGHIHILHLHRGHILHLFLNLSLKLARHSKQLHAIIQHNLHANHNPLGIVAAAAHLNAAHLLHALQLFGNQINDILNRRIGNQKLAIKAK